MKKTVIYAGTRNLYPLMEVPLKSLLANNVIDQVYLLIEDDEFPTQLHCCTSTSDLSTSSSSRGLTIL